MGGNGGTHNDSIVSQEAQQQQVYLSVANAKTPEAPDSSNAMTTHGAAINGVGTQWILSSTWRVREDYIRDIEGALHEFGMDNFTFADITDPTLHSERQWEIHEWLPQKQQQQSQSQEDGDQRIVWLALDDEELIEGDTNAKYRTIFEGHVVKTESSVGLTVQDVDLALELWKKQQQQ